MRDNSDVVARVKADLEARGVNLSGPCGAFEITRRVAWALRDQGAGLLRKPTGNNCMGYSVDVIMFTDGTWVDCLINAETENRPAWQIGADKLDPVRFQAATEVDVGQAPAPTPAPTVPVEANAVERLIDAAGDIIVGLEEVVSATDRLMNEIRSLRANGVRLRL